MLGCVPLIATNKVMLNKNNFYQLIFDANEAMLSAALFYWSKPLAHKVNVWAARLYERSPRLKALPGSQNAGTERNYKSTYICFRICSAITLVSAVIFSILDSLR
jgi:hypothetical protein